MPSCPATSEASLLATAFAIVLKLCPSRASDSRSPPLALTHSSARRPRRCAQLLAPSAARLVLQLRMAGWAAEPRQGARQGVRRWSCTAAAVGTTAAWRHSIVAAVLGVARRLQRKQK